MGPSRGYDRAAMIYDADWLNRQISAGMSPKFVFFWGHRPRADGALSKSCFSQWFDAPFDVDGVHYHTAEHWMMARKAELFNDPSAREKILSNPKPGAAKAYGREVQNFDQGTWVEHRIDIAISGNLHKFGQNRELANYLLGTGDRVLVEASPVDAIWGIGLEATDERCLDPSAWQGLNLLGFALMVVRDRLRDHTV